LETINDEINTNPCATVPSTVTTSPPSTVSSPLPEESIKHLKIGDLEVDRVTGTFVLNNTISNTTGIFSDVAANYGALKNCSERINKVLTCNCIYININSTRNDTVDCCLLMSIYVIAVCQKVLYFLYI